MAKVNYDYPLNPTWNNPCIFGSSLDHRWYVYANYTVNDKRFQYKESSGLNNTLDTLETRIQKAEIVKANLIEKLLTRPFEPKIKSFIKTYSEEQIIVDLIDEYLSELKIRVSYHTYHNYKTIFNALKHDYPDSSLAEINKRLITNFLKGFKVKPQPKRSYKIYLSSFFNWLIDVKEISKTSNLVIKNNSQLGNF